MDIILGYYNYTLRYTIWISVMASGDDRRSQDSYKNRYSISYLNAQQNISQLPCRIIWKNLKHCMGLTQSQSSDSTYTNFFCNQYNVLGQIALQFYITFNTANNTGRTYQDTSYCIQHFFCFCKTRVMVFL